MPKPKSDYSIQTVSNALRLLESFFSENELGVSELSRRLGLHKNNVFRLLATLEQAGYIEQSPSNERYRLGARCVELGSAFSRGHDLMRCARPILESLAADLGESAHLGVLRDFQVIHLDAVQPQQLVLAASRVGLRLPAHSTALGKAMLAGGDDMLRELFFQSVVAERGLEARTDETIADPEKLMEHLSSVRVRGFAVDLSESVEGLHCGAAPVLDAEGRVLGALSVSAPASRLGESLLFGRVAERIQEAATELSRALGHSA